MTGLKSQGIQPRDVVHPGEILLEEFIKPMRMTQVALSTKLGWTTTKLSEIVCGRRGVSADSAIDLAHVFGTTPQFWMNLQVFYDVDQALKVREQSRLTASKVLSVGESKRRYGRHRG